jgi:AcrR family transcriptional regulator
VRGCGPRDATDTVAVEAPWRRADRAVTARVATFELRRTFYVRLQTAAHSYSIYSAADRSSRRIMRVAMFRSSIWHYPQSRRTFALFRNPEFHLTGYVPRHTVAGRAGTENGCSFSISRRAGIQKENERSFLTSSNGRQAVAGRTSFGCLSPVTAHRELGRERVAKAMPKLQGQTVERNQIHIEDTALSIFTRQGYHGTSVREIAEAAGISLGNIYNYYQTKEEIFESLVRRYSQRMAVLQAEQLTPLLGSMSDQNLQSLSRAVREIVSNNQDYWRLMYIDVVEFGNKHFSHIYQDFPNALRNLNPDAFPSKKTSNGVDPAMAFSTVYLQFFLYYLVETLFGGKDHLGVPEEQAIAHFIRVATRGFGDQAAPRSKEKHRSVVRSKASRIRRKQ